MPAANIVGGEGNGFKTVLGAMNAERVLIAAECIGDGRFFIDRATQYANEREVFGRPIGENQGVAFPIAEAYAELEAAALMVNHAADRIDQGLPSGEQANLAKYLAAEASVRHLLAIASETFHASFLSAASVCAVAGWRRVLADAWRVRLRDGVRHRAQVARDATVPHRAHLYQPHHVLRRSERTGSAAKLLARALVIEWIGLAFAADPWWCQSDLLARIPVGAAQHLHEDKHAHRVAAAAPIVRRESIPQRKNALLRGH